MIAKSSITKKSIIFLLIASWAMIAFNTGRDYFDFQTALTSKYKTPWYSNSMAEPYTTLRLKFADPKDVNEYWTKNAIGSENWHVRDVKVGDITFWTLLERNPIEEK